MRDLPTDAISGVRGLRKAAERLLPLAPGIGKALMAGTDQVPVRASSAG